MSERLRVLYSFPNKLGGARICYTAWQQVNGLAGAGADVFAFPASSCRPLAPTVVLWPTLARGRLRMPFKFLGKKRGRFLHDCIVARRIERLAGQIDIVHTWPLGAAKTLEAAAKYGIPTVLERPNAHTGFAMEVVRQECKRLGVALPPDHEHAYNPDKLRKEEEEYRLAYRLLCPSDFVVRTFLDKGFPRDKLVRHQYGFDRATYYPNGRREDTRCGLTMLFAGVCDVRKGVHYALEAWLRSPAHRDGTFLIAGEFLPAYAEKLAPMLSDPSVRVLGHRNDMPQLMRESDIVILPSIEEGYPLVIAEAMGSGCVPLASEACAESVRHMETGLVHQVGDVAALTNHITMLSQDRNLLERLRAASLTASSEATWTVAGAKLLQVYLETIAAHSRQKLQETA